jgi:hypothetical protein
MYLCYGCSGGANYNEDVQVLGDVGEIVLYTLVHDTTLPAWTSLASPISRTLNAARSLLAELDVRRSAS